MRFSGKKIEALAIGEVALPRPNNEHLFFTVRALTYEDESDAKKLFPDIEPPVEFLKDDRENPLRDPDTGKVVHAPNYLNPTFMAGQERAEALRVVFKVVKALDREERIEWESEAEGKVRYEEIAQELDDAGISYGDINLILSKAVELGNMDADVIERAAQAFSWREQAQAKADR